MKTIILLLFVIITISSVWSQERPFERKGEFRGRKPSGREMREMQHLRFVKHILSEECIKEAEITPEQADKLKMEFNKLDKEMFEINKKIGELSRNQAEIATKVLTVPDSDPSEMFKLTEEIGKLRTEQAKHSVKVLIVVRDTLRPEQCAKVVEMMKKAREKMKKRIEEMKKNRREGGRGRGFERDFPKRPDFDPPPPPANEI